MNVYTFIAIVPKDITNLLLNELLKLNVNMPKWEKKRILVKTLGGEFFVRMWKKSKKCHS